MSLAHKLDAVSTSRLRQLHRGVVSSRQEIVRLFESARQNRVLLNNGVDRKSEPRVATITSVSDSELVVYAPNLIVQGRPQFYLHFDLDDTRYFFASPPIGGGGERPLRLGLPAAVYEAERRDLLRESISDDAKSAPRVLLQSDSGREIEGRLTDWSYQGMGVAVERGDADSIGDRCVVEVREGKYAGESRFAVVRRRVADSSDAKWTRIGLEASRISQKPPFSIERRSRILEGGPARQTWRRVALAGAVAKRLPLAMLRRDSRAMAIESVQYLNSQAQEIVGLVDQACGGTGGLAVVIPPAWGRTKESFLPLAMTLCATFQKAKIPISVLRFDGTNRRGESFIDPEARGEGDEYLRFRFSQAVEDIRSSLEFAREEFRPEKTLLLSFSLGSVEARRAAALEGEKLDAWLSIVGMVDLQSGLRTVSGGLDFAYGQSLGVEFGRHELVGVVADMDRTGRDAFENNLVFFEDAKRDMAKLSLPISWIHGRYDAWMEIDRVQALMASGPTENRRLMEIPSGHQMRSSAEALETFQLASSEAMRMCFGRQVEPALPDLRDLELRTAMERERRPASRLDRAGFWSDYLLGRDRRLGFELMSATSPYRGLMTTQIRRLNIERQHHILDLGGGTGDFCVNLGEGAYQLPDRVTQVDLVPDALSRSRDRLSRFEELGFAVNHIAADLEVGQKISIPLASSSVDSVLASLVLSYVDDAQSLLQEIGRVLKPGGRLVLSSMKRDADISRIYVNSLAELPPDRRVAHFGSSSADDFDELQRVFLNDAAKLLQMEEDGRFRFYDVAELEDEIRRSGLRLIASDTAFGEPAQAVVVSAERPIE